MQGRRLGSYRVVSCIGEGGMGAVYRAEHTLLGRAAAVKVLLPELSENQDMVHRFFNEARATAQLRHPGIIDVFDFGYCEDGAAFIVMELLHGESLTTRIAREGRLPWLQACGFARQIASALAAAHRAQIVHRDLKPDNVFLVTEPDQPEERTKVLDFGVAKLADAGSSGLVQTQPDTIMGTPEYMSPQQCRGAGQVDHRADIYSLGCILFKMVCGRPPFMSKKLVDLLDAQMTLPPPRPRKLTPELPEALEQMILRMLAKREVDRPQSMEAVAAGLDAIVAASGAVGRGAPRPLSMGRSGGDSGSSRSSAITTIGGSASQLVTPAPPPRRRLRYVFVGAAAVGVAGVTAVAAYRDPAKIVSDEARTTNVAPERAPQPVVHELGCDPGCEVMLDGAVVGKAAPGNPYRVELPEPKGQWRTYVLRPIDKQHRETEGATLPATPGQSD
jgi:serine/threonine protein kinase